LSLPILFPVLYWPFLVTKTRVKKAQACYTIKDVPWFQESRHIVNCKESHWAAVVLDFHAHIIWHGDSLGWELELKLKSVLDW
jgi:hypothetical protein